MAFQLSPGVLVVEKDLTNIVPAVATSIGGIVGAFVWGPADDIKIVSNEAELVRSFGKPTDATAADWFCAANFLSYSANLKVVRSIGSDALNATADGTGLLIKNDLDWEANYEAGQGTVGIVAAKYPGLLGDSLRVQMADGAASSITLTGTVSVSLDGTAVTGAGTAFDTQVLPGSLIRTSAGVAVGTVLSITGATAMTLTAGAAVALAAATNVISEWEFISQVDSAPGTSSYAAGLGGSGDELHLFVIDETGLWTGTPGTVIEQHLFMSKAKDARSEQGANNYWKERLRASRYIRWMDHQTASNWGNDAAGTTFTALTIPTSVVLGGGDAGTAPTDGEKMISWDFFKNAETVDVSLLMGASHSLTVSRHIIQNVAEYRLDCVAFVSPLLASIQAAPGAEALAIVANRNTLGVNSSYGFMDSGWKYQYDKYNDVYRWVPLNGDMAGLAARTDDIADPWFSPGGYNRGQIKNVVKLLFAPNRTDRDEMYKKGINPVITAPGEGTLLLGDKTLLAKPSAFDRINVRRLFIVLEKAIAIAAKYQLFEFNDEFTRAQFRNMVEPFLRDVQGRRGIFDFRVICDESNNTPEVIDRNEFIADIYIKPARSINFITLNFIATRTGVAFEELVGA